MQRWWHRRRNKEERWNREMLLGILGNPWSLQDGCVEVDPNPAASARCLPIVNPEIPAEPTATRTRNEENGRRIYITKKMVSEFGATLGCRGCLVIPTTSHGGMSSQEYRTDGERSCAREAPRRQSEQEKTNSPPRNRRLLCPVRAEQMPRNVCVKTNWKCHKNPRTLDPLEVTWTGE